MKIMAGLAVPPPMRWPRRHDLLRAIGPDFHGNPGANKDGKACVLIPASALKVVPTASRVMTHGESCMGIRPKTFARLARQHALAWLKRARP
jgi:hypothetical protein